MSHLEQLPFRLGTWISSTDESGNDLSADLVGREYDVPFLDPNNSVSQPVKLKNASNIRVRIVKNASGGTLTAKKAVVYSTTDGKHGLEVAGHPTASHPKVAHFVDPLVGSVPNGALFYVVVGGTTIAKTSTTLPSAIAAGDPVAVDAGGGIIKLELSATPTDQEVFDRVLAAVGVAAEARATTDTDTDTLIRLEWRA